MTSRGGDISQQHGFRVESIDHKIKTPITIQVSNSQPSPRPGTRERTARRCPYTLKLTFAIAKEQCLLRVTRSPLVRIHSRIYVTIHYEKIEPAVVVKIKKACAPTQKWNRDFTDSRLKRHVSEIVVAVVVIKHVRIIGEVGDVKIHAPVIIVITNGQAHSRL